MTDPLSEVLRALPASVRRRVIGKQPDASRAGLEAEEARLEVVDVNGQGGEPYDMNEVLEIIEAGFQGMKRHDEITHIPADPINCPACRIAKQRRAPAKKGSAIEHETTTVFGQQTHFDHVVTGTKDFSIGINGHKYGLPVRDSGTGFVTLVQVAESTRTK